MWYYVKENKQEGPVPQSKMHEMFNAGILGAATLIWSDNLSKWTPAFKVEAFLVKVIPYPPPLPKQEPPPIPSLGLLAGIQVRPWVRFWARMFDLCSFSLLAGFVLVFFHPSMSNMPDFALGMLIIFIWIFVESSLISTWGSTPGKWLFKTSLRNGAGDKLTFSSALTRSFSVWWRGLGIGFPIVILITLAIAHNNLTKDGITSWDREGNFIVSHDKIGPMRVIVAIIFFIGYFYLIGLLTAYQRHS